VLLRPSRNAVIMVRTENVTNITLRNSTVYCGGPRYGWVSENVSSGIPLLRVAREENVRHYRSLQGSGGGVQNFVYNNILVLPAPRRVEFTAAVRSFPAPPSSASLSKGWYSDPAGNERLKSHINREWDQRRSTQQPSGAVNDPGGPQVRLTAPTVAEKRAALSEIASTPAPAPWTGSGRSGNVSRGADVSGGERSGSLPKALPVRPQSPLSQPKTSGAGAGPTVEAGPERGIIGQPARSGSLNSTGSPAGLFGGQQMLRTESGKAAPGSGGVGASERTPGFVGRNGLPSSPNSQNSRVGQPPQELEGLNPRTQSKTSVGQNAENGMVPGGAVVPVRPTGQSTSGFSQPPVSRSGSNFPPQGAFGAPSVTPRGGGATESPLGSIGRSGAGSAPIQATPLPRTAQPAAIVDQPARFPRSGPAPSPQPVQSSPASSAGLSVGGRSQTAPPVTSGTPQSAPAQPSGAGQKKKPGDPGYVPGNP
jgi:hypothetical protein